MKSPITGKEMVLCREHRDMEFRKERFELIFHFYKCEDSGEQFTTTELDELNLNQLYNQYRYKNNIPFVDEIVEIRKKYEVPASTMSDILGFGTNTYRNYENGEIPSKANAKLISLADDPAQFKKLVNECSTLDEKMQNKILKRVDRLIAASPEHQGRSNVLDYLLGSSNRGIYTGFRKPDFDKLAQMVIYFAEKMRPYKTKMNKLLFYADFICFRRTGFSISGVQYVAIDYGPVPNNFQSIFEYLTNKGFIERVIQSYEPGREGTQFAPVQAHEFDKTLFTETELEVLNHVANRFKDLTSTKIMELSHLEPAWIKNENNKSLISYELAFELEENDSVAVSC